jgi:hypothetical protein
MVQEMAPVRRQLGALGKMARRKRIFARLREGASYEEIAGEESVSRERVRRIVSEVLQKRSIDSGSDHAKLQLDRLAPVMQLAAEAIAAGDVAAITPYLKVLDRLDRYQTVAVGHQVYDDEARKKLMDKINRMAAKGKTRRSTGCPSDGLACNLKGELRGPRIFLFGFAVTL